MPILYAFAVFFVYFLFPTDALAWGPGAHMTYALHALSQAAVLAPPIAALLKKYPNIFLYGTIAADIIFAKKFAGELYHCHHWEVALPLLEKAKEERERAFLYGYLGHLAVDTVAHNFFVPYHLIAGYEGKKGHTYWEMRFDEKMNPKVWDKLGEVAKGDYVHLDHFLQGNLKRTIFSFSTNKKIFNSLLIIQRMKKWRQATSLLAKRSPYKLVESDVNYFRKLCCEVIVEFLQDPENARVRRADPSGKLKLLYATEMVKDLRRYTKRRVISKARADKLVVDIKQGLKRSLYQPGDLPVITDALH